MRQQSYKLAVSTVAFCILAMPSGCALRTGAELSLMPKGIFCTPDETEPGTALCTDEVSSADETCSTPPAASCGPKRLNIFRGLLSGSMAEPTPLVDARQTRSQFHPVPTRPVFLPQPNRGMMVVPSADRPAMTPMNTDQIGSPQIEMLLPDPPPEALPVPPATGTKDRVTGKPSWIFMATADRRSSAAASSRFVADSTARPLRR
jgi:hypothetical protein